MGQWTKTKIWDKDDSYLKKIVATFSEICRNV